MSFSFQSPLLAQSAAAVADTVVTISGSSTGLQRWVDILTSISSIVIAVALVAIAIPLIPAAWNSRKTYRRVDRIVTRVERDLDPLLSRAEGIVDNVSYVTGSIRSEVESFRGTIQESQRRLDHAARAAEQRISDFNAFLEIVQEEAEDLFIDTASTIHGVRAGSDALRRPVRRPTWDEVEEER